MSNPLTKLQHRWVAIEITPVDVFRRMDGEIVAIHNPDAETQVQMGCENCDATPSEGWHTLCNGGENEA